MQSKEMVLIIQSYFVCSAKVKCGLLLSKGPLFFCWFLILFTSLTVILLIFCIIKSKMSAQSMVALNAVLQHVVTLVMLLLLVSVHHEYSHNYPLQRASRLTKVACTSHSLLSTMTLPIPSSSLLLLTLIRE